MTKITLNDLSTISGNEQSAINLINTNNALIETASDNTLSRDGTPPNQMLADLDMNSQRVLNLPTPASGAEPLRLQDLSDFIGTGTISPGIAGPVSSTDNAIIRFDGTTGRTIQNSLITIDDTGNVLGTRSTWISKTLTTIPADAGGNTPSINLNQVTADNVDGGTGFIIGAQNRYVFGGSTVKGGRISNYNFVANTAITNAANANRNYVGSVDVAYTAVGDGGSDTSTNAKGGYFGANPSVHLDTGATNVLNATPFESDVMLSTGSSSRYASCGSFVGFNAVRGSEVDAGITFGGGTAHIGWKHGILFSDYNRATTENPFYSGSTIIGTYWQAGGSGVPTVTSGIDFGDGSTTGFLFTGNAFKSKGFSVDGTGNSISNTVRSPGSIKSTGTTGGVGYAVGAGGSVTQGAGSGKATGVTLDNVCGEITLNNALLAAATIVSFTLTSAAISATDTLVLNHVTTGTLGAYTLNAQCAGGSATVSIRNNTAGSLSEAIVIRYAVIKATIT